MQILWISWSIEWMATRNLTYLCSIGNEESSYCARMASGGVDHEIVLEEGRDVVLGTCAGVDGTRQMRP